MIIVLVAVALAVAFGLWRAATDGRFAGTHEVKGADAPAVEVEAHPAAALVAEAGAELGERVTLLQFSSAFCAPCRVTRRVLEEVATSVPGVAHVEVDAEHHLEATRAFKVLRTPTTLVLDAEGREVSRASGAPRKEQVLSAVAAAIGE